MAPTQPARQHTAAAIVPLALFALFLTSVAVAIWLMVDNATPTDRLSAATPDRAAATTSSTAASD